MIRYTLGSRNPAAHYFDIRLEIETPDPAGQVLRMPAWIPGSYMIRDFARHIVELAARGDDQPLKVRQLDKSTYQVEPCNAALVVEYRVYAWDLSVRGAHLDLTHGFFNGTSLFLEVLGQSEGPCRLVIDAPELADGKDWRVATTLPRISGDLFDFGEFEAADYAELIDHPVEMGRFQQFSFEACAVRHDVVFTGQCEYDEQRLMTDLQRVCSSHIGMFGEPAPMQRYLFLVMVVGEGYGGLEHRSSTSLLCSRKNLPLPGIEPGKEYRQFLGLCSHEYFHSWNVKRIQPQVLREADLSAEVYTPLLWAFEGITSYYDDLALVRSRCISREHYLEQLAQTMSRVLRGGGRLRQSVADSSFNAWTRFYKQDENAANAIVSYYAKGCLVALCIDLRLRQLSAQQKSLDDVMRALWQRYLENRGGVADSDIQELVNNLAGQDLGQELADWIEGCADLPLQELLAGQGIEFSLRANACFQDKGGATAEQVWISALGANLKEAAAGLEVLSVEEQGAAQTCGLAAGDLIIAWNGVKACLADIELDLRRLAPGTPRQVTGFRRDELIQFELRLQAAAHNTVVLSMAQDHAIELDAWLGSESTTASG